MYARLRSASSAPSVCFICRHWSQLPRPRYSEGRNYATQAALAARPLQPRSVEPASNDQGFSTTSSPHSRSSSSNLAPDRQKAESPAEVTRVKQKARKPSRKLLKEAEEAERRRKALAVLEKTTKFVAAINDTHLHEPTLEDLDQLRPKEPPIITLNYVYPDPSRLRHGSPSDIVVKRYSAAFHGLVETLTQKFTRKQLMKMYKDGKRQRSDVQFGPPRPVASMKTRRDVAGEIVRRLWQWPYVTEVAERRAYLVEKSERVFPMGTNEFFLLLGPDGSSLLGLTESLKVVIKQVTRTEDGFSLVIEGSNYTLDRLTVILTERKQAILSEMVSVDVPNSPNSTTVTIHNSIGPELLQRISKLSEALVEDKGNGMFQISAHHLRNIEVATRLTTRALQQTAFPPPSLLVHLSTTRDAVPGMIFPHTYALFPLELPKAASLPWSWIPTGLVHSPSSPVAARDHTPAPRAFSTGTPSLFRTRRVSDWLGQDISSDASHLKRGLGRVLSSVGQPHALRDALGLLDVDLLEATSNSARQRRVTASTGYIAFAAAAGTQNNLLPPFPGSWPFPNLLDWLGADEGRFTFIPSIPTPLARSVPLYRTVTNQLVYRSLVPNSRAVGLLTPRPSEPLNTLKVDISLDPPSQSRECLVLDVNQNVDNWKMTDSSGSVHNDFTSQGRPVSVDKFKILSGAESFVNVMLPDRPIDVQLSIFDSMPVLPNSEPPEIRTYASSLTQYFADLSDGKSRPDPPLHVTYEGARYVLVSNATVRQSSQTATEVLTEHIVDLEGDQQAVTCQVICTQPNAPTTWEMFLEDCDKLTWLVEREEEITISKFLKHDGTGDSQEIY